jgi:hypothetical protein
LCELRSRCEPWAWIDQALPKMPPPVAALVRLQPLTGTRPGELVALRAAMIAHRFRLS